MSLEEVDNFFFGLVDGELGYLGSTIDFFKDNLMVIETFIKKSKSPKMKKKLGGQPVYLFFSNYIFEKYGVSTLDGAPLSVGAVGKYLNIARNSAQPLPVEPKVSSNKKILVSPMVEEKKTVAVSQPEEKPSVSVPVGEFNHKKSNKYWGRDEYLKAWELLKADGWSIDKYKAMAVEAYSQFAKNRYMPLPWNEDFEILWVITKAKFPELDKENNHRALTTLTDRLYFGDFWKFLTSSKTWD
ncbi:MAG: hypothetical protein PHW29_04390 [Flavobacterium sp.]|nr:hypothetical protein [Flavobacterium sp.]